MPSTNHICDGIDNSESKFIKWLRLALNNTHSPKGLDFVKITIINIEILTKLNSHYEAWSYKKKKHRKIKGYRKSV